MHLYTHKFFFFSSRRRHTRCSRDWSSDVCSSDLAKGWMAELPPEIVKVAVVVDAGWDEAISLAALPFISALQLDRKSTRLNSSHGYISYAVFCLKKKKHYLSTPHHRSYLRRRAMH